MLHNRYLQRGGEDEVVDAEMAAMSEAGIEVHCFQADNSDVAAVGSLATAARAIWSRTTYRLVRRLIEERGFDVLHVHNFFPLISPAVYYAARSEGVAVVQTLHNYRLLCAAATFHRSGRVCESCLHRWPWPAVLYGCYRASRPASAAVALMSSVHRTAGTWARAVDRYISPSKFTRDKFVEAGFPGEKIAIKPNFVHPDPGPGTGGGGYALFVGRLAPEKGLDTLLTAWARHRPALELRIAGDGPLAGRVAGAAATIPNISYLGRLPLAQVHDLMGGADVVIVPSEWYETFGRVVIEAFAKGAPVVVADIGAVAELVDAGRTGLRFAAGDSDDLGAKLGWLLAHPGEVARMRRDVRREYEDKYTAAANVRMLRGVYAAAIAAWSAGRAR